MGGLLPLGNHVVERKEERQRGVPFVEVVFFASCARANDVTPLRLSSSLRYPLEKSPPVITSRRTNSALCVVPVWPGMPLRRILPSTTVNFLFCSEFFFEVEFAEFLEQGSIVEHKEISLHSKKS